MGLETNPSYPNDLNPAYPADADMASQGAAHIRNLKTVMRNLFRDIDGNVLVPGDPAYGGTLDSVFYPRSVVIMPGKTNTVPTPPIPDDVVGGGGVWAVAGYLPLSLTSNDGLATVSAFDGMKELRVFVRNQ